MRPRRRNDCSLEGYVVVVSPHLDDAAFSLGAAIARAAHSGAVVRVLTVFAGDPDSDQPSSWWDKRAGFASEGDAARARREEDLEACRVLGATADWLPFSDASYEQQIDDEDLSQAVGAAVQGADVVLLPGFPLKHVDHLRLTQVLLSSRPPFEGTVGLYVEQPYAKWQGKRRPWHRPSLPTAIESLVVGPPVWRSLVSDRNDRRAKYRAAVAYRSQMPLFGRIETPFLGRLLQRRVALYEALRRGEAVAWLA